MKPCYGLLCSLVASVAALGPANLGACQNQAVDDARSAIGAYISTGDNYWLASWLPIDSPEPQDNGTFSEVSEEENDAALKHRPAWLDAP